MLNDKDLKNAILKGSTPKLSKDFYVRIGRLVEHESSHDQGSVLVGKAYLFKYQILVLLVIAIAATITLINLTSLHGDDDLNRIDALSLSGFLTI